jgi:hypothetical protein
MLAAVKWQQKVEKMFFFVDPKLIPRDLTQLAVSAVINLVKNKILKMQ